MPVREQVKGIALAPAELEDLLLGHLLVSDTAVIGIPDSYAGEVPRAFVVLKDKENETDDTKEILLNFVREKKSRFKWLDGGLVFVDEIPKSTSGKILRRLLKDKESNVTRKDGSKL
jgi:4-coumarate--CoA ligase